MRQSIIEAISEHKARPAIMASPGAARYGEGLHASCSCGYKGEGHGKGDNARVAAQADAHEHIADEIMKAMLVTH